MFYSSTGIDNEQVEHIGLAISNDGTDFKRKPIKPIKQSDGTFIKVCPSFETSYEVRHLTFQFL